MAMTPDSGGGGGTIGTTGGGICTISTSDLIGLQNNILTRLLKLEQLLTLITGMDVRTGELSDITDNLGTVTNATIINALRGWITEGTFSGVAISTLGWTMYNPCTGQNEAFPIVVVDEDGVMQFGADTNGVLCGEAVQSWNNAAAADYYVWAVGDQVAASPDQSEGTGVTVTDEDVNVDGGTDQPLNYVTFQVAQDGVYLVSVHANAELNNTTGSIFPYLQARFYATAPGGSVQADNSSYEWERPVVDNQSTISSTVAVRMSAGHSVKVSANVGTYGSGTVTYRHLNHYRASIIWVAPL